MKCNAQPVALVTGAARGIGLGIAKRLLEVGWNVAIADVLEKEGNRVVARLNHKRSKQTSRVIFISCDVADESQVAAAVSRTFRDLGRIDALVNNAGIAHPYNTPVEKLSLDDWNRKIAVNLTGPFLCAKHAALYLRRAPGGGAVVNISSTRAFLAEPQTESYNASKAGLLGLTRSLALSLGPQIRVNAICPGWIDTRSVKAVAAAAKREKHAQHPVGRVGRPEDIAELALFLLDSKRSGFITGQTVICDGGMRVKMIYEEQLNAHSSCRRRVGAHDLKWNARDNLVVHMDIKRIQCRLRKRQPLEIDDEIALDKRRFVGNFSDGHFKPRFMLALEHAAPVRVNECDAEMVCADVHRAEDDAQRQCAMRVHSRKAVGVYRVERAQYAQLAVIIGGAIADDGCEDFHGSGGEVGV